MKISFLKISIVSLVLIICGFGFMVKDQIRILWIQKQAISNFNSNFEHFNSLQPQIKSNYFHSTTLEGNDTIVITVSNVDIRNLDFSAGKNNWERYERIIRLNVDDVHIKSFNDSSGKLSIYQNEKIKELTDWILHFRGLKTEIKNIESFKVLGINLNMIERQISNLDKIKCRSLLVHKYGIELTYNDGFVFKAGCVVKKYYPVKYNIGKGDFLNKVGRPKSLDSTTQCYIQY